MGEAVPRGPVSGRGEPRRKQGHWLHPPTERGGHPTEELKVAGEDPTGIRVIKLRDTGAVGRKGPTNGRQGDPLTGDLHLGGRKDGTPTRAVGRRGQRKVEVNDPSG